jgi:hypothetical protein
MLKPRSGRLLCESCVGNAESDANGRLGGPMAWVCEPARPTRNRCRRCRRKGLAEQRRVHGEAVRPKGILLLRQKIDSLPQTQVECFSC